MFIPVSIDHIEERKSLVRDICKLISYLFIIFIFFLIVIIFYINYEHWNLTDTIYFVICTISTVGYGEPVPSNDGSRLFTIFFIIFGIFVIFAGIKDFIHNNLPVLRDFLFCKSFSQQVTEDLEIGDFYHYRKRLVLYTVLLSLWIIIGSIAVKENEEWTWIEALYFMIETSSTVGYGDMKVKRGSTKVFLCVYIIVSTLLVTLIIRTFQASMDEQDQLVLYEKRLKKMRRLNTLYSDSSDPMKDIESLYIPTRNYADQPITTHQLLLDLLIQSGKLDPATDINPWLQKINRISNEQNEISVKEELDAFLLEESNIAKEKLNRLLNQRKFSLESWQRSFFPWLFKTSSQDEEHSTHPPVIGVGMRRPLNLKFPKDHILGEESVLADDEEHALGKDSQLTQRIEMVRSPLRAIKSEVSLRNPINKAGKSNLIATKGASPYVRIPEDYASSDASAVDQSDREL